MTEQFNAFEEKSKRIDIALKYTDGDMEKAKEMAAGHLLDIKVVKGKYINEADGTSGLFLAFFNIIKEFIPAIKLVVNAHSQLFDNTRIFDEWTALFKDMAKLSKSEDNQPSMELSEQLVSGFLQYDLFPYVVESKLDVLTDSVKKVLQESLNDQKVQVQLDVGDTSSLEMDTNGISAEIEEIEPKSSVDAVPQAGATEQEKRIAAIENEANYIIEGEAVISPVKGKFLQDVIVGDRIKILLSGQDTVTEKILSVLDAYDEERNILPVKGRIKEMIPLEKTGYIIYAVVAKGVYAKIVEEENVKILLDGPKQKKAVESEKKTRDVAGLAMIGFLIFLILVAVVILAVLL